MPSLGWAQAADSSADFLRGRSFDPRLVRPATDDFGFGGVEGTGSLEWGEYGATVSISHAWSVARLGSDPSAPELERARRDLALIDNALSTTLGMQLGLLGHGASRGSGASLGVVLPVHVLEGDAHVIERSYNTGARELHSQGIGAPALVLKWAPRSGRHADLGFAMLMQGDLGVDGVLRSDPGAISLWPRVALDWTASPAVLTLNAGYRFVSGQGPQLTDGLRYDDQVTLDAAARASMVGPLEAGVELHAAQLVKDFGEAHALSSELLAALRVKLGDAHVLLSAGLGLGDGFLASDARVMMVVSFRGPQRDPDGDRFAGDADKCPNSAEDFDLHADRDGCPEPDNDADSVPDARDLCANDPGPGTASGCPIRALGDRDHDGFSDYVDDCPSTAGPEHGCATEGATHGE